jgi:fructose-1,6-bisphosphatase
MLVLFHADIQADNRQEHRSLLPFLGSIFLGILNGNSLLHGAAGVHEFGDIPRPILRTWLQ